jgi:hypothetical protein
MNQVDAADTIAESGIEHYSRHFEADWIIVVVGRNEMTRNDIAAAVMILADGEVKVPGRSLTAQQ